MDLGKREKKVSLSQNKENNSLGAIVKGLIVLAIIVVIAVMAITFIINNTSTGLLIFFDKLTSLDAAIVVALITGCVSILTVVGGAIVNNILKNKHEKDEYLRIHREEPYTQLIKIFYKMLKTSKNNQTYSQEEMLDDMMEFNQGLTLWGSSKAIKKWDEWRIMSSREAGEPYEIMHGMEAVLIQLRIDMGEKRGLKQGDLLKLFVNDYDEVMQKSKK